MTEDRPGATDAPTDGFIRGGYVPAAGVNLPPIEQVERDSIYQDSTTGTMWRATKAGDSGGTWIKVNLVTASEHARLKRRGLTYLLIALACNGGGVDIHERRDRPVQRVSDPHASACTHSPRLPVGLAPEQQSPCRTSRRSTAWGRSTDDTEYETRHRLAEPFGWNALRPESAV